MTLKKTFNNNRRSFINHEGGIIYNGNSIEIERGYTHYKKKSPNSIKKLLLPLILIAGITFCSGYLINSEHIKKKESVLESTLNENRINLKINNNLEEFIFSQEPVGPRELNQGIVVWEKIVTKKEKGKEVYFPTGHLYVFKDIKDRKIVGKFAVSGGKLGKETKSIYNGAYVICKFEKDPDFFNDITQELVLEGGHPKNPWGHGKFYQYPVLNQGDLLKILSAKKINRSQYPDKNRRYLHGCKLTDENLNPTAGCTRTSNNTINFLTEGINLGEFRLGYTLNIPK